MLMLTKTSPTERNRLETRRPPAQMTGSALGYLDLSCVDMVIPSGTPTIPDNIITTPNMKETWSVLIPLSSSGIVCSPSSMNLGPHHDRAPVTNVTQVNANVENTKLLFLARPVMSS